MRHTNRILRHSLRSSAGALASLSFAVLAAALLSACVAPQDDTREFAWDEPQGEQKSTTALSGDALVQRKHELDRTHRDLVHFHSTLRSIKHRRDRSGFLLLASFLDAYMGVHLDPLLRDQWQSRHPEVMALDANLRLVQAEVLIQMRKPAEAQRVVKELEKRYEGREDMLVEYPIGSQGTLGEGIQILSDRRWWKG